LESLAKQIVMHCRSLESQGCRGVVYLREELDKSPTPVAAVQRFTDVV